MSNNVQHVFCKYEQKDDFGQERGFNQVCYVWITSAFFFCRYRFSRVFVVRFRFFL